MGILMSALAPYNNDLYASNLAHIPVLAIHGSDDSNVPPRHSREHVALVGVWEGDRNSIKLIEVPKRGHYWEDMLQEEQVTKWIEDLPGRRDPQADRKKGFTITTANPQESGGRGGIRILEMDTPGRCAYPRARADETGWRDLMSTPDNGGEMDSRTA